MVVLSVPPDRRWGKAGGVAWREYWLTGHDRLSGPEQLHPVKLLYPDGAGRECQHQVEGVPQQQLAVSCGSRRRTRVTAWLALKRSLAQLEQQFGS